MAAAVPKLLRGPSPFPEDVPLRRSAPHARGGPDKPPVRPAARNQAWDRGVGLASILPWTRMESIPTWPRLAAGLSLRGVPGAQPLTPRRAGQADPQVQTLLAVVDQSHALTEKRG